MWLGRRYERGRYSNLTNTKPLISALVHHARTELKLSLDVLPYPGMELAEREGVHRVCVALAEIEDMAPRRSIPLTALLMRMFITEGAVTPVAWYAGMTVDEMCTLRDVAR